MGLTDRHIPCSCPECVDLVRRADAAPNLAEKVEALEARAVAAETALAAKRAEVEDCLFRHPRKNDQIVSRLRALLDVPDQPNPGEAEPYDHREMNAKGDGQ